MSLDGWVSATLQELTTKIGSGATPRGGKKSYKTEGISLIRSLNVHDRYFKTKNLAFVDDEQAALLDNVVLDDDDVLLNITGASVARCCVVPNIHLPARVNQHVAIVRADQSAILPKFLCYLLTSKEYKDQLLATGEKQGATRQALTKSLIQNFHVKYPNEVAEQKRIVSILDEAFSAIAKAKENAEKNLANARELFESYLNRVFTQQGPGWQEKTVTDVARKERGSMRTGPFGSQMLHSEFVDEGIAVLGIDNAVHNEFRWGKRRFVTVEKYAELTRYTVKLGDVIITIMGTNGRCAVIPDNIPVAINSKHLCCITLDQKQCLPEYIHVYFLHHPTALEFLRQRAKRAFSRD